MVSPLLQMKLLTWKSYLTRKRSILSIISELLVPVLIFILWCWINKVFSLTDETGKKLINETYYPIEKIGQTPLSVYYAPSNDKVKNIMNMVKEKFCHDCNMNACEEEGELFDEYLQKDSENKDIVGIFFHDINKSILPNKLTYTIKKSPMVTMQMIYSTNPPLQAQEFMTYKTGFCSLQGSVDSAFIELKKKETQTSRTNNFVITNQQFPDPTHTEIKPLNKIVINNIIVLVVVVGYVFVFVSLLQSIMEEKCNGIKEIMKVMGFHSWMLMIGWYIHFMSLSVITITICTILLKVSIFRDISAILEHGNAILFWVFLFLYCTSGVCFFILMSTLFSSAVVALSVAPLIWFLPSVLQGMVLSKLHGPVILYISSILLIFPNNCLGHGIETIYAFENLGIGIQWGTLFSKPHEFDLLTSFGILMIVLVIDSIIFLILAWYIDSVYPGEYGAGKPWSFPFKKSFWYSKSQQTNESKPDHYNEEHKSKNFKAEIEAAPFNITAGIAIKDLYKTFKEKTVVNGLNFEVYSNQLTVLLGHNGAGKTTTMNIITGMINPTHGDVLVNGYSVKNQMEKIRGFIGLCPQHNFNFPALTVTEHLMFFAMLRGMDKSKARRESLNYLAMLSMSAKAKKVVKTLSGGMMRRVCLGMALIGDTKVLLLDEPTSGMDPEARREIWDLLLNIRGEKTILLTTHYMEEADVLGDRIAIMHSGELMCYGTSMFLKKFYGTGYIMSVILLQGYNINAIQQYIAQFVPGTKVKNITTGSAKFELPTNNTQVLTRLFTDLDDKRESLRIGGFGVSITTMEDVFLKVGKIADQIKENEKTQQLSSNISTHSLRETYNSGFGLLRQQCWTLILKRYHFSRAMAATLLISIIYPIILDIMPLLYPKPSEPEALHLKMYSDSITYYYSHSKEIADLKDYYTKIVEDEMSRVISTSSVSDNVLRIALEDMDEYKKLIIAAELNYSDNKMTCNAMYGRYPIHALPISINVISNALLKYYMNDKSHEYSIAVINNPFPFTGSNFTNFMQNLSKCLGLLGLAVYFGGMIEYSVRERVTGVKHLQIMSGVSRVLYWFCIFIVDFAIYCLIITIYILLSYFTEKSMKSTSAICTLVYFYILFGLAIWSFYYFFHYRPTPGNAATFVLLITLIFGMILPLAFLYWEGQNATTQKHTHIIQGLVYVLMLCPLFTYVYGIIHFYSQTNDIYEWESISENRRKKICATEFGLKRYACCKPESSQCTTFLSYYSGENSMLLIFIYFIICSILYTGLFLFVDYGLARKYYEKFTSRKKISKDKEEVLDSDVVAEQIRINTIIINNKEKDIYDRNTIDMLLVSKLQKWFGKFHAVKGLSFGVKEFECFGLLGINGAGKTTTFKMLTGDINMSSGTAQIYEFSLAKNKAKYTQEIGYCPQFDAFNTLLTTRQMLTCFANLRGIPETDVKREVDGWLKRFDILKYEHINCDNLSGGNKRKLSTAMALIGDPPLIFLDEPTSGIDPEARRNLWSILSVCRKSGQALVLTSHSMDECEALCDRLGIMVDGQLRCIGDIQYLKNKFGQGFTLIVKLRPIQLYKKRGTIDFDTALKNLKSNIKSKYDCYMLDAHKGMLTYHVNNKGVTIGGMFQYMENLKGTMYIIEDFTAGDTSLEEIFLTFAKEKIAAGDKKKLL